MASSGGEIRHRPELGEPSVSGGEAIEPAGICHVGPAPVIGVLSDGRGENRVSFERLGEEGVDAG